MPLEARPQGLVDCRSQNPRCHSLPQPPFTILSLSRPVPTVGPFEVFKRRIRVNAISPGSIDTPTTGGNGSKGEPR